MFHMLAICTILYPCRIDEALEQQMKEKITFDKLTKMQGKIFDEIFEFELKKISDGDVKIFEEVFNFSCPKFVSPTQPPIVPPHTNTHLEPTARQWRVFEEELDIQAKIPGTRRYLKLYTTMPLSKLAGFMEVSDSELLSLLMAAKCKLKNSTDNYDEHSDDFLHPEVPRNKLFSTFCFQNLYSRFRSISSLMIRWFILPIPVSGPDMENNSSEKSKSSSKWKKLSKEKSSKYKYLNIVMIWLVETQKRSITKSSNPIESPRFLVRSNMVI